MKSPFLREITYQDPRDSGRDAMILPRHAQTLDLWSYPRQDVLALSPRRCFYKLMCCSLSLGHR